MLNRSWQKKGCIIKPQNISDWWVSHAMAPTAIQLNNEIIRIYVGCWDVEGISRIGYIDVHAENPTVISNISKDPILDIGTPGTFDENGVFPGHAAVYDSNIYLYYTGFQLGFKIRHYNFGGLAISKNGHSFERASLAPLLDRTDEGLFVRAGQSLLVDNATYHTCYSAGSGWQNVGGKERPIYDVYYQSTVNATEFSKAGIPIIKRNQVEEHGLGRPQLVKLENDYFVFYTRRTLDMRYQMGCAISSDLTFWKRIDEWVNLPHGSPESFDSDMVYFPSVIQTRSGKIFLFYSGNDFGKGGLGVAELV